MGELSSAKGHLGIYGRPHKAIDVKISLLEAEFRVLPAAALAGPEQILLQASRGPWARCSPPLSQTMLRHCYREAVTLSMEMRTQSYGPIKVYLQNQVED